MMIEKLDLNHLRYVITVAARTDAGWGWKQGTVIGSNNCDINYAICILYVFFNKRL